jgi:hypothetical protein
MNVYINKGAPGYHEMNPDSDPGIPGAGTAWEDYEAGMWVKLAPAQVAFRDAHPSASKREVFEMKPAPPPERTLADAIREKLMEIDRYDNDVVNQFTIMFGDTAVPCWFDAQQRSTYQTSINARRKLIVTGLTADDNIRLPVAGQIVSIQIDAAEIMLAQLQCYADTAFIVTEMHRVAVSQLTDIDGADGYDHTAGYPVRLTFNL